MANEKQTCPLCGTKLKLIDGKMTCKQCGYYVREQDEQSGQNQTGYISGQTGQTQSTYNSGQTQNPQYNSANQPWQPTGSANPPKAKSGNTGVVIGIVVGVILLCVVVVGGLTALLVGNLMRLEPEVDTDHLIVNSATPTPESSASAGAQSSILGSFRYMPKSDFFCQLAEVIFDKPLSDITEEEFASLTALEINTDDQTIYYQVYNMDGSPLYYESGIQMDMSDLRYFPGLEWISLVGDEFDKGDLDGLENLYAVYSENNLSDLTSIIPYPENIYELGFEASFLDHNLSGIERFPNLEYLYVVGDELTDISALKDFPNLKGLAMYDFNSLTDYSPLMSLTSLEELVIHSNQLKTIDFIRVMPNLTNLEIEDSQITDISALSSCPELTQLYLIDNYSVTDYTPVGDLVYLTDLTIFKDAHAPIPSLEKLTSLERASFKGLWENGELSLAAAAPNISVLYLERCYDDNLSALTHLPLISLTIKGSGSSVSGASPLEPLTQLPLEYLNLSDLYVFGNMEVVFGIPTLRYLYMDEGNGVIDFDKVDTNENLVVLSMNGYEIDAEAYSYDNLYLSDHYDFFEHFPNLEELYLAEMEIDSIEFVENLPNLQYLDITDNNVTSLKPLENLSNFRKVWCGSNTILEWVSEDSGIVVDSESYYYGY